MTDLVWPRDLPPSAMRWSLVDATAASQSPVTGAIRTSSLYGTQRWACEVDMRNLHGTQRARMLSILAQLKRGNRIWVPNFAARRAGSFPAGELLTNAEFSQGTFGWSATDTTQLTASNGRLRATRKKGSLAYTEAYQTAGAGVMTQYAPHVMRALHDRSRWLNGNTVGCSHSDGTLSGFDYPTTHRMTTAVLVPVTATFGSAYPIVADNVGVAPNSYIDVLFTSRSRCFLVDNGPNFFTRSSDLSHADWTKVNATVSSSETAPDGTNSAFAITPNTASSLHYAYQAYTVASSQETYTITGAFKSNGYEFVRLQMGHATGAVLQLFNLSAGNLGTTATTGDGWQNRRSSISALGDGWYQCSITARKTSADTSLEGILAVSNADSASVYSGDGSSGIRAWRPSMSSSHVPMRMTATQSAAVPSGTPQSGGSIHVKGLPASTDGLLLPGDWVEINGQLKMVTAPLNSDACGLGVLSVEPAIYSAVSDNTPIIVHMPMARMMVSDDVSYSTQPGLISDSTVRLVEASS